MSLFPFSFLLVLILFIYFIYWQLASPSRTWTGFFNSSLNCLVVITFFLINIYSIEFNNSNLLYVFVAKITLTRVCKILDFHQNTQNKRVRESKKNVNQLFVKTKIYKMKHQRFNMENM